MQPEKPTKKDELIEIDEDGEQIEKEEDETWLYNVYVKRYYCYTVEAENEDDAVDSYWDADGDCYENEVTDVERVE